MIDPGNSQEQKEVDEVVVAEQQQGSSDESQHPVTQQTDEETKQVAMGEMQVTSDETPVQRGKKRVKKVPQVTEAELMPRPSLWPLALSISVAVALGGFAFNLIILGVGVIMVIVSVIGWSLERR